MDENPYKASEVPMHLAPREAWQRPPLTIWPLAMGAIAALAFLIAAVAAVVDRWLFGFGRR
jgi:hypothetical protein